MKTRTQHINRALYRTILGLIACMAVCCVFVVIVIYKFVQDNKHHCRDYFSRGEAQDAMLNGNRSLDLNKDGEACNNYTYGQ